MTRIVLALCLAWAAPARADDWLVVHPPCAFDARARTPGRAAILYPREGLPALVEAGERLVARVRVPSALTPPPGIQKDRALIGWSAELRATPLALGPSRGLRYPVRVADVRPDSHSSLLYRVSLPVPRWVAPGSYTVRITMPGGAAAEAGTVRVLVPDVAPRAARLAPPAGVDPEALAALLARLPIDVWIVGADAPELPGAPLLRPAAVVVRAGEQAWALGACDGPYRPFAAELDALRGQGLRVVRLDDEPPAPGCYRRIGQPDGPDVRRPPPEEPAGCGGDRFAVALPPLDAVSITISDRSLVARSPVDAELLVLFPDDRRSTTVEPATAAVRFFPAAPVPEAGYAAGVAARLAIPAGVEVVLRRGRVGARPALRIRADPAEPLAGVPIHLRAEPAGGLVAWTFEEDETAVGGSARHAFDGPGDHEVHAVAISADGVLSTASLPLVVRARTGGGCAAGGGTDPEGIAILLLLLLLFRIGAAGNRVRSSPRS